MKPIRIIGENLKEKLLIGITVPNTGTTSFGIPIKLTINGEITEGKLVLHTKGHVRENIFSFTGTLLYGEVSVPCIGYHYSDEQFEECCLTIIEPTTEIFNVKITKTEFIQAAKKYYEAGGLKYTEDGNLIDGFILFEKADIPRSISSPFYSQDRSIEVYPRIHKNLFPILRYTKARDMCESFYGEFIDETTIRTYSTEEAWLKGAFVE